MARIVGGVTTSHIPAIGNAIADRKENEPYWRRFFAGYEPVKDWLSKVQPDIAIVIYNDHGLNFFLDNIPTFAIGCADHYENADEGWGLKTLSAFEGDAQLSWHLAESLIVHGFDMATCQHMLVDHGFTVPMSLMWRHLPKWPVKVVPLAINTVRHPVPAADVLQGSSVEPLRHDSNQDGLHLRIIERRMVALENRSSREPALRRAEVTINDRLQLPCQTVSEILIPKRLCPRQAIWP